MSRKGSSAVTDAQDRRCELIRRGNIRVAERARSLRFDDSTPVPFLCECDDELCQEFVLLTLAAYERAVRERLFAVAPAHSIDGGRPHERGEAWDLVRRRAER
jgi:hypothetical protein